VTLTPAGSEVAECIIRRFETLRGILVELFGLDEETAELDACTMEHAVSPMTVNRMERVLELVRDRKLKPPRWAAPRKRPATAQCAECEATGICQAEARAELR
jgi:Mn-dependent DtxR family transcriptional regulator